MKRRSVITLVAVLLLGNSASAEIYEWRDDAGARHFTNRKELVPSDRRATARVIVPVLESEADETEPETVPVAVEREVRPQGAEVVRGGRDSSREYLAGLRDGAAALSRAADDGRGGVNIIGPLAVAVGGAASSSPAYPGLYPLGAYAYPPLVTTSFDRGRSRHLTLRMLLQDQFQFDREGPYRYERLNAPGLGPNLRPFLSRGLPRRVPRGGRVIFR